MFVLLPMLAFHKEYIKTNLLILHDFRRYLFGKPWQFWSYCSFYLALFKIWARIIQDYWVFVYILYTHSLAKVGNQE